MTLLACLVLVVVLGMAAFAVDIGYLANSQTELQRAADAAALAGCWQLVYQGTPGTPIDLSAGVAAAPTAAADYARLNPVCGSTPSLGREDVVVGYMANPGQPGATITAGDPNTYNAIKVTVRRSADRNGLVPSFLGGIFGAHGVATSASATAALISNVGGFEAPSGAGGPGNLMILPFAYDQESWCALLHGTGTDDWTYDPVDGRVKAGADHVLEMNLFPQGTGSPGNRGTVNIGASNNSTATLCRQIESGISPSDLAHYPNSQLKCDGNGDLFLNADPGISAGCKSSLASIIGQTRCIPIFKSLTGNGNNATYDIAGFVAVRILDVNLTGSMSNKHLTVQPACVFTRGVIPAASSAVQQSYGIYSPVWLVH